MEQLTASYVDSSFSVAEQAIRLFKEGKDEEARLLIREQIALGEGILNEGLLVAERVQKG